jgi:hypothetical protein
MATSFDVLDRLYQLINHSSVAAVIDGGVWRRKKPQDRRVKDVVIHILTIDEGDDLNSGTAVINMYAPMLSAGMHDEASLEAMLDAVKARLDDYSASDGSWFTTRIESETLIQDVDDPHLSYLSLRVNYHIDR